MRLILLAVALLGSLSVHAAASFQLLTPRAISVPGGESQDVSIRFFSASGQPAAGEVVSIRNDACGQFSNGQLATTLVTDSSGTVTTRFTARNPPGITCWIWASAGVTATIDVLTYRVSEVRMQVTTDPAVPRVGKPYTVRVRPMWGAYSLMEVDVNARTIAGTASAAITPASGNTGVLGYAEFTVTPTDAIGEYAIEAAYRTQKAMLPIAAPAAPWQDMWWAGAAEDGWGVSIVQHRDMLFAVIYAYDAAGKPTWFVVPGGAWNAAKTEFTGAAYVPTGSPFYAYDAARFLVGPAVGSVRLAFSGANHASLEYTLEGKSARKDLVRNEFGPVDIQQQPGAGDMWWGGVAQNGWGIAVLQQDKTLFSVWFTYDAAGAPTWLVMPGGTWIATDTYAGHIYRASSSPWLGANYDAAKFHAADVGTYRLRFTGDAATFDYVVDGRSGTIPLSRNPF